MLYPQNGDSFVTIDSVTTSPYMYKLRYMHFCFKCSNYIHDSTLKDENGNN